MNILWILWIFIESNKGKHFTLSDRISIEAGIEKGWSFKKIADELGKSPSSVSREVRRHLIFSLHYYDDRSRRKTECIYFSSCSKQGVCGNLSCSSLCSKCRSRKCASFCPSFTTAKCETGKKPPFFLILNMKKAVDHKWKTALNHILYCFVWRFNWLSMSRPAYITLSIVTTFLSLSGI